MMANTTDAASVDFYYVFTTVTLSLFIVIAFFGNLVVLIVFAYTKELQTVINYFLVSLAFADLLTAILPMPLWLAVKVNNDRWPFSIALLKAWQCMDLTLCTSSIWNLCAISIDRCWAIALPFGHRTAQTPFRVKCAVLAVWCYSLTVSVLITDVVAWRRRGLLISFLSYYIPTVIIILAYLTIYVSEMRARLQLESQTEDGMRLKQRCKQDLKMAKYMMLLITSFIVCWAGHFILSTHFAFDGPMPDHFLADFIKAMSYLNSCLNPFLYGYVSPKFRAAFLGIFHCYRRRAYRGMRLPSRPVPMSSQRTSSTKLDERAPRSPKGETNV